MRGHFSYSSSTGNYFTVTLDAVKKFQRAQGVLTTGYFGPQSRVAANRLISEAGKPVISPLPSASPRPTVTVISPPPPQLAATTSPYKGKIAIDYVSGTGSNPSYETITLKNRHQTERISITGFRIETVQGGRFIVPRGHEIPGLYPTGDDLIILKPGERAVITAGKQDRKMDFRLNLCTGYFDETSSFTPSLSHQCPAIDTKPLYQFSDRCIDWVRSLSTCRTARPGRIADPDCNKFIEEHFSYVGCVRDYRSRPDFFLGEWRIWMQRDQEFFRNSREKITLRDAEGKVADEYSY